MKVLDLDVCEVMVDGKPEVRPYHVECDTDHLRSFMRGASRVIPETRGNELLIHTLTDTIIITRPESRR